MIPSEMLIKLGFYIGAPLLGFLGVWIYGKAKKTQGVNQGRSDLVNEYKEIAIDKQILFHDQQRKIYDDYENQASASDDWTDAELLNAKTRRSDAGKEL